MRRTGWDCLYIGKMAFPSCFVKSELFESRIKIVVLHKTINSVICDKVALHTQS